MSKQVWSCDKCGNIWNSEEEATKCEESHIDKNQIELTGINHSDKRGITCRIPSHIHVKFSDKGADFASYKLDHYGR